MNYQQILKDFLSNPIITHQISIDFVLDVFKLVFNVTIDIQPQQLSDSVSRLQAIINFLLKYFHKNQYVQDTISTNIIRIIFKQYEKKKSQTIEGFVESDSEDEENIQKKKIIRSKYLIGNKNDRRRSSLFLELNNQIQEIDILHQKLELRDKMINDLTQGYFKDLSHFNQVLHKDQHYEMFEVNYFDLTKGLDEEAKLIVQQCKDQMRMIYQKQIQMLNERFSALQENSEKLRRNLDLFKDQTSVQALLKTVFLLEKNPYKLWKLIQDNVGNDYFFQVFENPKHDYGINYKEIFKLIFNSSASDKVYQNCKQMIDDKLIILTQRFNREKNYFKEKAENSEKQLQEYSHFNREMPKKVEFPQVKQMIQQISEQNEIKRIDKYFDNYLVKQTYEQKMKDWIKDWKSVSLKELLKRNMQKSAIEKWSTINRYSQFYDKISKYLQEITQINEDKLNIQDFLRQSKYVSECSNYLKQFKQQLLHPKKINENEIEKQNKELKDKVEEQRIQINRLENDLDCSLLINEKIEIQHQQLILEIEQLQIYNCKLRDQQFDLEQQIKILQQSVEYILSKVGFRQMEISLNMFKKDGQRYQKQLKEFEQKLKKMNVSDRKLLQEYILAAEKERQVVESKYNKQQFQVNEGSMTIYFDVMNNDNDIIISCITRQLSWNSNIKEKQISKINYLIIRKHKQIL